MSKSPRGIEYFPREGILKDIDQLMAVHVKKRFDNKGGHPHVILEDIDDKHVSVGLSTSPKKGKNATNVN